MEFLYEKGAVKLTKDKAYVLVYEKEYRQSSASNEDIIEDIDSQSKYESCFSRIDEGVLATDDASERENDEDEYSDWYKSNVEYEYNELFDVQTVSADFSDYTESVKVLEFDIDLEDINLEDIYYVYVNKDTNRKFVSDRKKTLIIVTEDEDLEKEEFKFEY